MINITQEERERCRSEIPFLRETLEKELEKTRVQLEAAPLETVRILQGKIANLRDIIELLN
jgi:hypothetical protein